VCALPGAHVCFNLHLRWHASLRAEHISVFTISFIFAAIIIIVIIVIIVTI
jgi:hypothetical protein